MGFTMKVFPALVIIVIVAGFCSAKELGDTSSARCSVKDKFVRNRSNAFEFIRDIRNWRKCGEICNRTDDCSFWSFLELGFREGFCYLYSSDADKELFDLPSAFSGERMPGVIFQDQKFMGMTNNRINTVLDALPSL